MKLALITDIHYGIRNDHQALLENNKRFFDNSFFPYLKEHKIDTIICLGDLVDRRKFINFNTAQRLREDFIEKMYSNGVRQFDWILGNHDIYYRQNLDISAASELYKYYAHLEDAGLHFPEFHYYTHPTEKIFDGTKILFMPWICEANKEQTFEKINTTDARIVFGHLEIQGFEMFKGHVSHHGENADLFAKFDTVCTGHYHHRSSFGNINYLGAHGEFSWADCGDDRGFHVFDTGNRTLDFIPNPYPMFKKIFYDDTNENFKKTDFQSLSGKFIKVIVTNRNNPIHYDWFLNKIEEAAPLEYTIVQDHLNLDMTEDESIVNESKDTLSIVRDFIKAGNTGVNAIKLDNLFVELYQLAQSTE